MNKDTRNASKTASSARVKARRAVEDIGDEITNTAVSAKRGVARARAAAAAYTDEFAEDLDAAVDSAGGFARRTVSGLSHRAGELSDSLRGGSLSDALNDAQGFARRNPVVVLAGAMLIGLLLSRAARPARSKGSRRT